LTLPAVLAAVAVCSTIARRSHRIGETRAIEIPAPGQTTNPSTLIKPQNVKYIG
jgi:hypothetical protein